jgi:WD40 repeat protein
MKSFQDNKTLLKRIYSYYKLPGRNRLCRELRNTTLLQVSLDLSRWPVVIHTIPDYNSILTVLPDGNIATSYHDTIRVWDVKNSYKCIKEIKLKIINMNSMLFLRNDDIVVGTVAEIIFSHADNYQTSHRFHLKNRTPIHVLIQLTGNTFLSGTEGELRIWDYTDGYNCIKYINGGATTAILLSCGWIAYSCGHEVRILNCFKDYETTNIMKGHSNLIYGLVELSNGNIVSGSEDFTMRVWDAMDSYKCIKIVQSQAGFVFMILIHDLYVLSSSDDNKIKIWDVDYGFQCVKELEAEEPPQILCTLPRDSNGLFAEGFGKHIKIWGI